MLACVAFSGRWLNGTIDHAEIMVTGNLKFFQASPHDAEIPFQKLTLMSALHDQYF